MRFFERSKGMRSHSRYPGFTDGRHLLSFRIRNCQVCHHRSFDSLHIKPYRQDFWPNLPLSDGCSSSAKRSGDSCRKWKGRFRAGWFIEEIAQEEVESRSHAMAYACWVEKHFPKARIVFDLFHVIKLMNERLDKLRRRYVKAESWSLWQRRSAGNYIEDLSAPLNSNSEGALFYGSNRRRGSRMESA